MRKLYVIFCTLFCILFGMNCSDKEAMIIPEDSEYIDFDVENNIIGKSEIELYQKACNRFNEFIYKDESGEYKTTLHRGRQINVSERVFTLIKDNLVYKAYTEQKLQEFKLEKSTLSRSTVVPQDPYEAYVFGQFKYIWYQIMKYSQLSIDVTADVITFLAKTVAAVVYVAISVCISILIPVSIDGPLVYPAIDERYNGPQLATSGTLKRTNLPDGIYPYPPIPGAGSNSYTYYFYIIVYNRQMECWSCEGSNRFSWNRSDPRFFRMDHSYFVNQ